MGEFWNPLRVSKNVTRTTGTTVGDSMITGLLLQEISTYVLSLVVTSQTNVLESYKRLILFTQAKWKISVRNIPTKFKSINILIVETVSKTMKN